MNCSSRRGLDSRDFGRLLATLKGYFTVVTDSGQLGVRGAEFEVVVGRAGRLEVQVLEGVVGLSGARTGEILEIHPLQRLAATGGESEPVSMAEGEVRGLVDWTHDVWVRSQSTYGEADEADRSAGETSDLKAKADERQDSGDYPCAIW